MKHLIWRAALAALLLPQGAPVLAQMNPGAYLAGRQAAADNDFAAASRYYTQSLVMDPSNPLLLESAATAFVALGQIDRAKPIADRMREAGIASQVAHLIEMVHAARNGRWQDIFEQLEADRGVSPLMDGLVQAWADIGMGNMTDALADFDAVIESEGMRSYGAYHKALALASVGDFEAANAILSAPDQQPLNARSVIAHAQVLSQLDNNAEALAMLEAVFGQTFDPTLTQLRDRLAAGESVPFDIVNDPVEGVGEIAYMISGLLQSDTQQTYTLVYSRVAEYLNPDNVDALMLTAELLQQMERHELAKDAYATVPQSSPQFPSAELGRIDALISLERPDAAIEVALALARSHPELPFVQSKLGDVLRMQEKYPEARDAYTAALDLYGPEDTARWVVYYMRGITSFAMDVWPDAEADFRAALAINPDQPQVLNYLGYSLVERGEKLDEALGMIEKAVAARPDSGAIVDSLGWVLFTLGRYDEAVTHLETAASLEATDPTITDHLGDALWAVGRRIEARFQWNRALSFDPDEKLATRIRAKLADGLDAVRAAEGAAPITLANDAD